MNLTLNQEVALAMLRADLIIVGMKDGKKPEEIIPFIEKKADSTPFGRRGALIAKEMRKQKDPKIQKEMAQEVNDILSSSSKEIKKHYMKELFELINAGGAVSVSQLFHLTTVVGKDVLNLTQEEINSAMIQ